MTLDGCFAVRPHQYCIHDECDVLSRVAFLPKIPEINRPRRLKTSGGFDKRGHNPRLDFWLYDWPIENVNPRNRTARRSWVWQWLGAKVKGIPLVHRTDVSGTSKVFWFWCMVSLVARLITPIVGIRHFCIKHVLHNYFRQGPNLYFSEHICKGTPDFPGVW